MSESSQLIRDHVNLYSHIPLVTTHLPYHYTHEKNGRSRRDGKGGCAGSIPDSLLPSVRLISPTPLVSLLSYISSTHNLFHLIIPSRPIPSYLSYHLYVTHPQALSHITHSYSSHVPMLSSPHTSHASYYPILTSYHSKSQGCISKNGHPICADQVPSSRKKMLTFI